MKTKTCIFAIYLLAGLTSSRAQDTWTQKADFGGTARYAAVGFSIGSKGYVGTGSDASGLKKDFWEYDPSTNVWTQKADFGGTARNAAASFAVGSKGYVGTGSDVAIRKDFWEYDPTTNIWTQKANFGGAARFGAVAFSIGTNGYIGTGFNGGCCPFNLLKDVWEYDPTTDTWTRKADFGGGVRGWATGLSVGNKGYVGTGQSDNTSHTITKDFWEFDPIADTWLQRADCGGNERELAVGFSIGSKGYIGTGGNENVSSFKDFWEYDPTDNTWTQKADFGGSAREYAKGFVIDGKGYIGTGANELGTFYKDFWEYTPGENSSTCLSPPAGLVSWWSGDRTANDVQGTNPGVLKNGASFRPGKAGPGFLLDGFDDWVRIPNSSSLSQTRITLDAWVYVTGKQGTDRHMIDKDNAAGEREYILALNADNRFHAFVHLPDGDKNLAGLTAPQLNTWYHVAMTHDGVTLKLYVNGQLDGTLDAVGDTVPTSNFVGIGGNTFGAFFQGSIDEAQIFDRALTDVEILAIYQAGTNGQCKPNIFVSSITPSYEVRGRQYLISTAVVIQDVNGVGIEDATTTIKTTFPDRSVLTFPAITDRTGQATISFYSTAPGRYQFKVRNANHPTREYDASLNIETSDTLVIP